MSAPTRLPVRNRLPSVADVPADGLVARLLVVRDLTRKDYRSSLRTNCKYLLHPSIHSLSAQCNTYLWCRECRCHGACYCWGMLVQYLIVLVGSTQAGLVYNINRFRHPPPRSSFFFLPFRPTSRSWRSSGMLASPSASSAAVNAMDCGLFVF